MAPNLHLKIGDVCYFYVNQKPSANGSFTNNFVLTESPISAAYGNTVKPLDGFTPVQNGTVKYVITDCTPRNFYYGSSVSGALGGQVFIKYDRK